MSGGGSTFQPIGLRDLPRILISGLCVALFVGSLYAVATSVSWRDIKIGPESVQSIRSKIHFGMDAKHVVDAIGEPDHTQVSDSQIMGHSYHSEFWYYGSLQVHLEDDRVTSISRW